MMGQGGRELRKWLRACQDLNLGPHPYQRSPREPESQDHPLACMIDCPGQTAGCRWNRVDCGPNVDRACGQALHAEDRRCAAAACTERAK